MQLSQALPKPSLSPVQELQDKTKTGGKKHKLPSVHSHKDDHPTHLHVTVHKEGAGEGGFGGGDGAGTVFTSTNSGVFNPS